MPDSPSAAGDAESSSSVLASLGHALRKIVGAGDGDRSLRAQLEEKIDEHEGENDDSREDENTSSNVTGSQKNTRMDNVCGAAKNNGVVIYTIGYEVPKDGTAETSLKKCATGYDPIEKSTAYYYSVDGLDISDAFGSIAGNVQALRLTQ